MHVVDGSEPAPQGQVTAVREVLAEIADEHGTSMPPELLVINKTDAVDATRIAELRRLLPDAVFASAHSGAGIQELRSIIAERLPRPEVFVTALVPYTRGDLVARVHSEGEVVVEEHTPDGTRISAKVQPELANALQQFARADSE